MAALPYLQHSCPVCALPLPLEACSGHPCGECQRQPPAFERTVAAFRYRDPIKQLIAQFKYQQGFRDGRLLALMLARQIHLRGHQVEAIIAMPLHPSRLRERGFNQSREIAGTLSKQLKLPCIDHRLRRQHDGQHQLGTDRSGRQQNVRHAFTCHLGRLPERVALIDDVMTTGATARAAAGCLKSAGVGYIELWVLARTPSPNSSF